MSTFHWDHAIGVFKAQACTGSAGAAGKATSKKRTKACVKTQTSRRFTGIRPHIDGY
jgi:hypothetical protein